MTVADCRVIQLPKVTDARGNLTFIEGCRHIPFAVRRAYWIYDVPGGEKRGGHAYKSLHEFVISLSGSFDVHLHDGAREQVVTLNRSYLGLYIPPPIWRHARNFSTNTVCLLLASEPYCEDDYIREWRGFLAWKGAGGDNA